MPTWKVRVFEEGAAHLHDRQKCRNHRIRKFCIIFQITVRTLVNIAIMLPVRCSGSFSSLFWSAFGSLIRSRCFRSRYVRIFPILPASTTPRDHTRHSRNLSQCWCCVSLDASRATAGYSSLQTTDERFFPPLSQTEFPQHVPIVKP